MAGDSVEFNFIANANSTLAQLKNINAQLLLMNTRLKTTHATGTKGAKTQGAELKNLALRFVGYNLVLNQAMQLQRKTVEYVADSIKKFREFETRIAEVSTIMGKDFKESIYGLQAGVESLSMTFGKNTSDMSKGLYDIMSAAFSAKEAIALLGTATKASIAGLADVRESVDIFTSVLNTYGMSAYEATSVSDALFQSVVRGKFQFRDLESALGYVVPIAAQAGIQFDELMAALSTATRHGLHLDMVSRGLALAIQNIINPTTQAAKAADKYGVQMDALTLRVKGLQGFFKELNDKSKDYGKVVLNDLIPNMRSLRVAMVLAGDEGVAGLAEDMDFLAAAAGRTEDALSKITETSQFVSNQIEQEFEQTQRNVGRAWDELALGGQRAVTNIVKDWKSFLPVIGPVFTAMDANHQRQMNNWKQQKNMQYRIIQGEVFRNDTMKKYLSLQNEIAATSEKVASKMERGEDYSEDYEKLLELQNISTNIQEDFNRAFGEPILGGIRNLEELETTMDQIEADVIRLKEELVTPISVGWGNYTKEIEGQLRLTLEQKKAEQARVDTVYDIDQAMRDANYTWKTNNQAVKDAVAVMREYEDAQEEVKKATSALNKEMVRLQIEALKIQIVGMMRRRGLNRSEQKRLKQIQIEQAKLRLEQMQTEYEATEVSEETYNEKQEFIDNYIADLKHEEYVLKYTLDNEIEDLQLHIQNEEDLLKDRETQWNDTNDEIIASSKNLVSELKKIASDPELVKLFGDFEIDIPGMLKETQAVQTEAEERTWLDSIKDLLSFSRGIEYMPETRPVLVHQGEKIVPEGRDIGGGTQIGNVTINVKSITDISSTEKLAAVLSEARDKKIISSSNPRARNNKGGNSYRVI